MNGFRKIRWILPLIRGFIIILIVAGWASSGNDVLGWLTLGVGLGIVFLLAAKDPLAGQVFMIAFLIRAIFALVHRYIVPLPDSQTDAITFERLAAEWAEGGLENVLFQFQDGAFLYSWCISLLYVTFGPSPLMAQGLNVLFGTLIVRNIYWISRLLWGTKIAKRAAWLTALFPTLVLYSAITLREVAVVYFFTLGVLYLVRFLKRENFTYAALAFLFFAISTVFHTGMIVGLMVEFLIVFGKWLQGFLIPRSLLAGKRSLIFLFLLLLWGGIIASGWGLNKVSGVVQSGSVIEWLVNQQSVAARGRAVYLHTTQPSSFLDLVWQTPVRIVYFLYAPFPWMVRSWVDLMGFLVVILNAFVTLLFVRSLGAIWRNSISRKLAYIIIGLVFVFALGSSNYGTSIRHSSKIIPLVLAIVKIPKVRF